MDSPDGHICAVVVFALLLILNFILSAAGAALQVLSDSLLEERAASDPKAEQALALKDEPLPLIRSCWFYSLLSVVPGAFACSRSRGGVLIALIIVCLALAYIFEKSLPRMVGKKFSVRFGVKNISLVRVAINISSPFTAVLSVISDLFARVLGINPKALEDEVTEDEILNMVNEGHEQGVLDEHEAEMINNIFQLDDTQARDIMTHRKAIVALEASLNLSEAIGCMVKASNSRFPVYEGSIDNIIGVIHLKDAVIAQSRGDYDRWLIRDVPDLIRHIDFIPETRSIDDLFRTMQHKKIQMVIVIDEYGETAGLVTMEDILEEIVGNILDEYDSDEQYIQSDGKGGYLLAGLTPLEEVEEVLDMPLVNEEYDTLNGLLVSLLDRIPDEEDHSVIELDGWSLTIVSVEERMIKLVHAVRKEKQSELKDNEKAS